MVPEMTEKPIEIFGLAQHSYFEFYVQGICSEETQSNWTGPSAFSTFPKQLDSKVFLEGPYDESSDVIKTTLTNNGLIPLEQPYNVSPWNYSGTEQLVSIPTDVVDWVLIEWRHAPSPADADLSTYVWRKAALLRNDGSVVDMDGSSLPWIGNPQLTGALYIIIRHRNHMDVIGNFGASLASEIYTYDFSDQLNKVYGEIDGHKQLDNSPLRYGMAAGDGTGDGHINIIDKSVTWGADAGKSIYSNGDFNMNGQTDNKDKNDVWRLNFGWSAFVQD